MSSPTDLPAILDGLEIRLEARPCRVHPAFTGVALQADGVRLIVVNSLQPLTRRRFTIAHEIAHIAFEHRPPRNPAHERLANVYATELLMPTPRILQQRREHGADVAYLAELNQVSPRAMERRLKELDDE